MASHPPPISRRNALRLGAGAAGALLLGCRTERIVGPGLGEIVQHHHDPTNLIGPGRHLIDVGDVLRKVVLHVPPGVDGTASAPLLLLYHGVLGTAAGMVEAFAPLADTHGIVVVAYDALAGTWDAVSERFEHDLSFANVALDVAFDRCRVDPARIGVAGFSDGATYALAVGRASGRLVSRIAAFSPGYLIEIDRRGRPGIFISHGTSDTVLPYPYTGSVVATQLDRDYDVRFRSFDGGHEIPLVIADEAMGWLAAGR